MSCCPTTYWCTPDGRVGVEADEGGVYTPPDDATAGPFATAEEAAEECPYTLGCGDQMITVPGRVLVAATSYTGDCGDTSTVTAYTVPYGDTEFVLSYVPDPAHGFQEVTYLACTIFQIFIGCDAEDAPDPDKPFFVLLAAGGCAAFIDGFTATSPWVDGGLPGAYAVLWFSQAEWEAGILYGDAGVVTTSDDPADPGGCPNVDAEFTVTFQEAT